ncbi:MAG: hypothetical protein ABI416_16175 [Ginsengibacter sp.]
MLPCKMQHLNGELFFNLKKRTTLPEFFHLNFYPSFYQALVDHTPEKSAT